VLSKTKVVNDFIFAHRSEVELSIENFNSIGSKVPLLSNLKPHGKVAIEIVN